MYFNWLSICNWYFLDILCKVYTWGMGKEGALGNGKETEEIVPFNVVIKTDIVDVKSGGFYSMAVTKTGELFAWGSSKNGEKSYFFQ